MINTFKKSSQLKRENVNKILNDWILLEPNSQILISHIF